MATKKLRYDEVLRLAAYLPNLAIGRKIDMELDSLTARLSRDLNIVATEAVVKLACEKLELSFKTVAPGTHQWRRMNTLIAANKALSARLVEVESHQKALDERLKELSDIFWPMYRNLQQEYVKGTLGNKGVKDNGAA